LVETNHLLYQQLAGLPNDQFPDYLKKYLDVFSDSNTKKLALYRDIDLTIDLIPGKELLYGLIYPLLPRELAVLKEFLEENLVKGFIRESKSPAGAPILFTPKKDRGLRLCVNYRGLNAITVKNRYPLPLITEIIDRVLGA
jgi:hypothetical protein